MTCPDCIPPLTQWPLERDTSSHYHRTKTSAYSCCVDDRILLIGRTLFCTYNFAFDLFLVQQLRWRHVLHCEMEMKSKNDRLQWQRWWRHRALSLFNILWIRIYFITFIFFCLYLYRFQFSCHSWTVVF